MTKAAASVKITLQPKHHLTRTYALQELDVIQTHTHTQMTPFIRFLNLCRHRDITVSYAGSFPPSVNENGWNHCLQVYY